jgi:pimeloyl-ACP methyl ester carboxylesterase
MASNDRSRSDDPVVAAFRSEARAVPEFAAFVATAGAMLTVVPRGDRHPVLVLPGLGGDDASTMPMRWFLGLLGYRTYGWELGVNRGATQRATEGMGRRVDELVATHHQRISIVGWSLGGIFARGLARRVPNDVRQVITLGSPLHSSPDAPPDVPLTSVYSKSDRIVPWQLSALPDAPLRESVEVRGSHLGLGHNPAVLAVLADRLAQPAGEWRPYRSPWWARGWFAA